ncbi:DNA mismatch repair protein MutL [Longibacter salinarum]|uniref:DNA mismatch repair protein MutL n=2 Tax=Longibacter salinarum TaxID=1850348 RepID=A0A2A8CWC1_9BACT|nr:DNA mismatch repair protein MutL [Longibacter salinarum]
MSDTLANKIAAGEVVQRPASVAKELIENAVDAGASSIDLIIKDAGSTLVQVIDDGCGMSRADARRCFDRHATSKIRSIEDLDRIRTLGFRGEALASIASISQVDLKTKRVEDDVGTDVRVEGGDVVHVQPCAAPNGTSIAVRNLFYNVPARRNFLKTPATELKHLTDTFRFLSLAHPGIAFRMEHKDRSLYDLPSISTDGGPLAALRQRVVDLMELDDDRSLLNVEDEASQVSVRGLVIDPTAGRRKKKGDQFLFVNERYVEDRYLSHAVRKAYGDLLPEKAFPFFALFLEMDPRRVDVNVHPTKAEVKFEDESGIYGFLKSAVRQALATANHTPRFQSGRTDLSSASRSSDESASRSGGTSSPSSAPDSDTSDDESSRPRFRGTPTSFQPRSGGGGASGESRSRRRKTFRSADSLDEASSGSEGGPSGSGTRRRSPGGSPSTDHTRSSPSRDASDAQAGELTHELYRQPEDGEASIGPVWSLHGQYLITPTEHGLLMIDQRAAHVRVLYEQALGQLRSDGSGESQQLLFPQTVELDSVEDAMIDDWMPELKALGFDLERLSGRTVQVRGVPVHVRGEDESTILQTVMDQLREGTSLPAEERKEHIAKTLAHQSAVQRGQELSREERRSLIRRLMSCEMPYADPSGTPTTLDVSMEEIEQRFRQ